MKVLLVNPPTDHLVKTFAPDSITEEMGFYPPMGLLYIATHALRVSDGRFRIEVLDTQVEGMNYARLREAFLEKRPDVVGISCMTFLLIDALKVARLAKETLPGVHVVIGGTHPTIYPAEMIAQPEVDSIVMGEGEITFTALLEALADKAPLAGIPGLGYKDGGRPVLNAPRDFLQDLDGLPFPDRELLPYRKYYNLLGGSREIMTSLLTSRGCPHNCVFCTAKDGRLCRMRSPENVVEEIEYCTARGITDFDIIDDTFTIHRKRVMAIAGRIIDRGLKITMDIRARVDQVDEDMLETLARAGVTRIRFGVESGDPRILKNLRKGITLDQVRTAFRMARNAGMTTFAYFMLGSPGETETEILKSIRLAREIDPDFVQFLITTPFPATELYRLGIEQGVLDGDYWKEFSAHPHGEFTPRWWTENMTHEELEAWQKKAHLRFYYRPRYVWNQVRRVKSFKELLRKARAGVRIATG